MFLRLDDIHRRIFRLIAQKCGDSNMEEASIRSELPINLMHVTCTVHTDLIHVAYTVHSNLTHLKYTAHTALDVRCIQGAHKPHVRAAYT